MNPVPGGKVIRRDDSSLDLVLVRRFNATIEDVWLSLTDPERTVRWFGAWRGDAGPGGSIEIQMGFETGSPWMPGTIEACDPPQDFTLETGEASGSWRLAVHLAEENGETTLTFTHYGVDPAMAENVGPGWEYYLDNLVATRNGESLPDFNDYYPSQQAYYQEQIAQSPS